MGTTDSLDDYLAEKLEAAITKGEWVIEFGEEWIRLPSYSEIQDFDPNLTVSIICVNWGSTPILPYTFASFAKQDYPKDKFEVIFVDDNSPDKEECINLVKKLMLKHKDLNIRFFETHKSINWNMTRSSNIGIKRANGDIILFCESDTLLVGKDFITATIKHHSRIGNLWLNPLCYGFLSDQARDECFKTDVDDIHNRDFENPTESKLDIIDQPITWNGGSVRKKYCFAIHGLDEGFYGWGGIDPNFWIRLHKIGLVGGQDYTMQSLHTYRPPFTSMPEYGKNILPGRGEETGFPVANPEEWGEIDSLEEINI